MLSNREKEMRQQKPTSRELRLETPATGAEMSKKETPGYYPGFHTLNQQNYWDSATRKVVLDRITRCQPIRFFSSEEILTMQSVVNRVLPQDDRLESSRIPILAGIDERLYLNRIEGYRYEDMPSDQDAYRLAAKAFEAMAQELSGSPFHMLEALEQEIILKSLHEGEPLAAKDLWRQMNVKRFWSMLVSDCCAVYYAHPSAWDEIGFGGPAYPRGYIRLEGGEAEPWEVDERRYEWLAPADTLSDQSETSGEQEASHHGQAGTH
jgi:hypothetical protein